MNRHKGCPWLETLAPWPPAQMPQHGGQCYPSRGTVQPHSNKGQVASCCLTPNQALPYPTFRLPQEPRQGILAVAHCLRR